MSFQLSERCQKSPFMYCLIASINTPLIRLVISASIKISEVSISVLFDSLYRSTTHPTQSFHRSMLSNPSRACSLTPLLSAELSFLNCLYQKCHLLVLKPGLTPASQAKCPTAASLPCPPEIFSSPFEKRASLYPANSKHATAAGSRSATDAWFLWSFVCWRGLRVSRVSANTYTAHHATSGASTPATTSLAVNAAKFCLSHVSKRINRFSHAAERYPAKRWRPPSAGMASRSRSSARSF